jgi:hypothetical protein
LSASRGIARRTSPRRRAAGALLLAMATTAACSASQPPVPAPQVSVAALDNPASPGSAEPYVALAPDGGFILSWVASLGDEGHALRYARRAPGGAWSEVREVARGRGWFVNWADFPSVVAHPDGSLWAHWLERSAQGKYDYGVKIARSADGETWSEPFTPHALGPGEHGFVSFVPLGPDMGIVWLDGRGMTGEHAAGEGATALFFNRMLPAGGAAGEQSLDSRVCDCCQTSAVRSGENVLVAYRDRSEREVRDISVVRLHDGVWSEPVGVSRDNWTIAGCPVNGPALAARGDHVALVWFSAPDEKGHVRLAISTDAGASFGEPIAVDQGQPLGRVDVALLDDGAALVSWLERREEGTVLLARRVMVDGKAEPPIVVASASAARSSGFPRLAVSGREALVAWTAPGEPSLVKTATLGLPGAP